MMCSVCKCPCIKVRYFPICPQCGRDYVDEDVARVMSAFVHTYGAAKGACKIQEALDEDREAIRRQAERQELWMESLDAVYRAEQDDQCPRRLQDREIRQWTERAFKRIVVDFYVNPSGETGVEYD